MSEAQFSTFKNHPFFGVEPTVLGRRLHLFLLLPWSRLVCGELGSSYACEMHPIFWVLCDSTCDCQGGRPGEEQNCFTERSIAWDVDELIFLRPSLHCYYVWKWQENNRGCNLQSIFGGASFELADHFSHSVTLSQGWHSMKLLWLLFFQPSEGVTSQMAVSKTWAVALTLEPNSAGLQRWDIERNCSNSNWVLLRLTSSHPSETQAPVKCWSSISWLVTIILQYFIGGFVMCGKSTCAVIRPLLAEALKTAFDQMTWVLKLVL